MDCWSFKDKVEQNIIHIKTMRNRAVLILMKSEDMCMCLLYHIDFTILLGQRKWRDVLLLSSCSSMHIIEKEIPLKLQRRINGISFSIICILLHDDDNKTFDPTIAHLFNKIYKYLNYESSLTSLHFLCP